jgi:hypothetical protein
MSSLSFLRSIQDRHAGSQAQYSHNKVIFVLDQVFHCFQWEKGRTGFPVNVRCKVRFFLLFNYFSFTFQYLT